MSWKGVLGRVSFINCEPIFHSIGPNWNVLSAPPSWLTGHLLRRDCLTAPIPTADYGKFQSELRLIPNIGIVSKGQVGSVLLLGHRPIESMRDIAIPSDSSTSTALLRWLLERKGNDPRLIEMGPDIDSMLEKCDGALLIGDRALDVARDEPESIVMDLGYEWTRITGLPMVFGVFAARIDSPIDHIREAHDTMVNQYEQFVNDPDVRKEVVSDVARRMQYDESRVERYFDEEVGNILDADGIRGLEYFLVEVCKAPEPPKWFDFEAN